MEDTAPNGNADTVEVLKELLAAAQAKLAAATERLSGNDVLITHLKLVIAKLQREKYGVRSERTARLIDQMELQLEELEANVSEDDLAAEKIAAGPLVTGFVRNKPARKPFPDHLPRERRVVPARRLWDAARQINLPL